MMNDIVERLQGDKGELSDLVRLLIQYQHDVPSELRQKIISLKNKQ